MAEMSPIILMKLKERNQFSSKKHQFFGNKSLLSNFYKRVMWVPLGGTNFCDLNY